MRSIIFILALAIPALGQDQSSAAPACGRHQAWFSVKVEKRQQNLDSPDKGMARVYFLQDTGGLYSPLWSGTWITKIGVDGRWVGANENNSYFSVSVDPGLHDLCVNAQSHTAELARVTELRQFTAEPGRTYFFRVRDLLWKIPMLIVEPIDQDQAEYMMAISPVAISKGTK